MMTAKVLIVGGGITGIQSAIDLSRMGCSVVLLERETDLGGKLKQLSTLFPGGISAREFIGEKLEYILDTETVQVKTGIRIERVTRQSNGYNIELAENGKPLEVSAVVLATGFDPFDPTPIEEYGYGRYRDIITAFELESQLQEGKVTRPSTGSPPRSVVLLQCVGSRDRRTNRYCSYFCCTYAIKEALAIRKQHPEAVIYILYMDIRTPYLYEHLYSDARRNGIRFVRSRVSGITEEDGLLKLDMENTLTGNSETLDSELVVLSTGGIPAAGNTRLAEQFHVSLTDEGFFKLSEPPVSTTVEGIFTAGAASGLKDVTQCLAEASASASAVRAFMNQREK